MKNLEEIFQLLGIDTTNGLYYTNDAEWKSLQLPNRVAKLLEDSIKPDAFFCMDNKPLILFFNNPSDKATLHKKIWNFNEVPIAIIVENDDSIEMFNGFNLLSNNVLEKIGDVDTLDNFTYFKLITGKTWEDYQECFNTKNRVDYKLLSNIHVSREQILSFFPQTQEDDVKKLYTKITNALLGKIIFVRYLIDRNVKIYFDGESREWTNSEFCGILNDPKDAKRFFDSLTDKDCGFNGDLFPLTDEEYAQIPIRAYETLIKLLQSQEISTGQMSLFNLYDFSIIPIEFISNVYEYFIGVEKQSKQGAYYTPLFLVDYILSETVDKHIIKEQTYKCKVLDPACGSGIFLVETLRKLIEKYSENANEDREQFKKDIKKITLDNIYGIDEDESAVQVAIFSVYLTLLDYMNPPEIATFQFPKLIGTNFCCSDFFNLSASFNTTFYDFDFIIGNPPWFRGQNEKKPLYIEYITSRKQCENTHNEPIIDIGSKEIAQAFLLRSSDFSTENTKCALIVTSKVLYNMQSRKFRKYFLHNYLIDSVFELASVNSEVFKSAKNPACILFFKYAHGGDTNQNLVEHIALKPSRFFSMFKIFTISRHDIKSVQQNKLAEYDWLWKILVYGSYLDFNLINRLNKYTSIKEIISDPNRFISGTGIQYSENPTYDAKHLQSYPFIEAEAIEPFFINSERISAFTKDRAHRIRKLQLFSAPMLLIRKGTDKQLVAKSALSEVDAVYKDSVVSIKSFSDKDIGILRNIEAILNSNIYAYYSINKFSSTGIATFGQSQYYDKFSIPYVETSLTELVKIIEREKIELHNLKQQLPIDNIKCSKIQKTIEEIQVHINEVILQELNFNEVERALLDYALNINRPLITRTERNKYEVLGKLQKPLDIRSQEIINYANVYLNRFKQNIDNKERKFVVRIWHTNQLLGMFFEVVPIDTPEENGIIWENADNKKILSWLIKLSSEKITDRLFVQKDIRGFEKELFYIFKPNEKRLWHKAIAYLDAEEFMDAILKAGRRGE